MKKFLDKNFLLDTPTSERLFYDFAVSMPIIDYHCHLSPQQIADDINFKNLTQAWLSGDHYKWRAMRANGISENFITGNESDENKFRKWAETVPFTLRNPLYHWTHLELQRYFAVDKLLTSQTCNEIYTTCSQLLQTKEYSVRNLLRKMNVKIVCTTDDPADDLQFHKKIKDDGFEIKILPAFRPDAAMNVDDVQTFISYIKKIEQVSNLKIKTFNDYTDALKQRHDFFAKMGCAVSDHGLEFICAEDYTDKEVESIFYKITNGKELLSDEKLKFRSAMLHLFSLWDHEKNWVQQYHLGAIRNNNDRLIELYGADAGCDSVGDFTHAKSLSRLLNNLDSSNQLAKTILYNLNSADNELFASMAGNFNDGSIPAKIQYGAAWWFLDQKDGITKQINTLSNLGLLSRFVGMLTDSRSFLSFPRHEYFRRILCNIFGEEIEKGELPDNIEWIGKIINDICYYNAKSYFNW